MAMTVKERQTLLKKHGFDPGPIDGIDGPKTKTATIEFKASIGLRPRPFVGPLTEAALRKGIKPGPQKLPGSLVVTPMPPWLRLAHGYLGLKEIPGSRHNAQILGMWERLKLPFRDDETPWCAGFVNAMVQDAGLSIVKKNRAAALGWRWNEYGTRLDGPALGTIMSMERPGKPGSGHMTIVAGRSNDWRILGLGGNQGNAVSINPYHPSARNAQYHWPEGYPLPEKTDINFLPIITEAGIQLTNEA
jgi:uncharacterized protein (TIGR02594 family)